MSNTIYLNGRFVDETQAQIGTDDGGWLHGAGLFETMRAENGQVFRLAFHLDRLRRSAEKLLAPIEIAALPPAPLLTELLIRNNLTSARIRMTVSAGPLRARSTESTTEPSTVSLSRDEGEKQANWTVCVTATPFTAYPAHFYQRGIRAAICNFRTSPSDPTTGHKTTSYLPRLLGLRQAQQARCFEAIWFTTANRLAEGSISNVFIVRNGTLTTPPLDTPVLPGSARSVVLELAQRCGLETAQRPLLIDDLLDADEVMLTNSMIQVMPVVAVEKHSIGRGKVGDIARRLLEDYRKLVHKECGLP